MKIAIVQLGRIGDLILATAAINLIKNKHPNAEIDFIVSKSNAKIIENNPNISRIVVFDKNPIKLIPFIFKLKIKLYDYYVDIKDHYSTESKIIAGLSNAIIKVGFNGKKKVFDIPIRSDKENINLHFLERIDNIFSFLEVEPLGKSNRPNLFISNASREYIKNYLSENKIEKYILINISASNNDKMWLEKKWIEFIDFVKMQTNSTIIIISDTKHFKSAENIAIRTNILHFPPTTLLNISALIRTSDLLISPDTSLIHIASTFDIPVISLTNNVDWSINKFAPLSPISEIILPESDKIFVPFISVEQVKTAYLRVVQMIYQTRL